MSRLDRIRALVMLLAAPACVGRTSGEPGPRGPEVPLAEVARRESPFEAGLQLLASEVVVELSRNYHQDPTLLLPAGAGELQKAQRREHGWAWLGAPGGTVLPLDFHFRRLKAKAIDRLVVDFPPVTEITLRLVARGDVFLVLPGGEERRGAELVIQAGRALLDGRELDLPPAECPP